MPSRPQQSHFELHTQGELLQRLERSVDEIARMSAQQWESVIQIARLLIEPVKLSTKEAL